MREVVLLSAEGSVILLPECHEPVEIVALCGLMIRLQMICLYAVVRWG